MSSSFLLGLDMRRINLAVMTSLVLSCTSTDSMGGEPVAHVVFGLVEQWGEALRGKHERRQIREEAGQSK